MNRRTLVFTMLVLGTASTETAAIDHKNLDEGRPLRLEDAYSISAGEFALEAGAGLRLERRRPDRGVFPIEILYGAAPNLQIGVGTTLLTTPHGLSGPEKSGDLALSGLYNFNQETISVPAFAAKVKLTLPTGIESKGVDVGVKGIVTKSFDRLSLHFNGEYEFFTEAAPDQRDGRYKLVLGASYPIGAPQFTRLTLIGDVFTEQSVQRGKANTVGTEIGVRYQLTPRLVWDVGVGTEFAGPRDRAPFSFTTGFSFGY